MQAYERLEYAVAAWAGFEPEQVVACSSGTAALVLALEAFRLPPGSEVIVPDLTMIACPRAVTMAGLRPVFVDCNENLLMNLGAVGKRCGFNDKPLGAIMAVHIYGRKMDVGMLREASAIHAPKVIEDMAELHGVRPHHQTDAACWSFFRNKVVHGEEGGAVAFRDPKHAAMARSLRNLGFTDAHDFMHEPRGMNYRLANLLAEPILRSLEMVELAIKTRRAFESVYDSLIPAGLRMPPRESPWVYDIRIPGMIRLEQDQLVRVLQAEGIEARHAFKTCTEQPEYWTVDHHRLGTSPSPNAFRLSREVIYLPLAGISPAGVTRAAEIVKRFADGIG